MEHGASKSPLADLNTCEGLQSIAASQSGATCWFGFALAATSLKL